MSNMYTNEALNQKMDTCASDLNDECLVTDLVHELSLGLEIPFLLGENIKTVDKTENISPLDSIFYDEPIKEKWEEDSYFSFTHNCGSTFTVKDEINNDFQCFLEKNSIERNHSTCGLSGSGSGSECSSTEFWTTKTELDTPPITPPDERISPDNVFLLTSDEFKFTSICTEESLLGEKQLNNFKSVNKRVRIQPKPVSTTLNIFDSHSLDFQTVKCNLVGDGNINTTKNQERALESKLFFNANYGKKKSLLTKKELELLQAKKKQERMIRNRESAYLSRKRKKEHLTHLEKQVQDLQTENKQLKLENSKLRQRLAKYENLEPPSGKRTGNVFTESPRKTTALLALLFTVCLNIGSFSSLMNEKKMYKSDNDIVNDNIVINYPSELRHTRSLLWADNDLGNLTSTYANLTKTSCPLSVNQTESIRLESELRRWIGGDEEHSRKAKYNVSKISQYFNSGERPSFPKIVSKQKHRTPKSNFQKKNLAMDMYQMNILNFNTFFEAIHRRDDTFYLVSFSSDHLLLPALSHNQTSRPKMSLMLPAYFSNVTGADQVEMMQIDCEVTNTQLLSVNENDIPSQIRPYSNSTSRSKDKTKTEGKKFEEYFMSDLPVTLVPAKKTHFKAGKNDLKFDNSSGNHSDLYSQTSQTKNLSTPSDFEVLNIQQPQLNFTLSRNDDYEDRNSQFLQFKRSVFFNHSYKQDQNAVDLVSSYGNNLLKLLMVGPTVTNSKNMKFNREKSSYKSFQNTTNFLFN